jgi:hypothetical protein
MIDDHMDGDEDDSDGDDGQTGKGKLRQMSDEERERVRQMKEVIHQCSTKC